MADTTIFTKYAEQNIVSGFREWLQTGTVQTRLYKQDFTLNIDTAFSSFSGFEADFDGYERKSLTFGLAAIDANKKGYITANQVTWGVSGAAGNTIYGWAIINTISGYQHLVEAKKYSQSAPDNRKDMTASGNTMSITHTIRAFDTSIDP